MISGNDPIINKLTVQLADFATLEEGYTLSKQPGWLHWFAGKEVAGEKEAYTPGTYRVINWQNIFNKSMDPEIQARCNQFIENNKENFSENHLPFLKEIQKKQSLLGISPETIEEAIKIATPPTSVANSTEVSSDDDDDIFEDAVSGEPPLSNSSPTESRTEAINYMWLGGSVSKAQLSSLRETATALYDKSRSQNPMTEKEWLESAQVMSLLIQNGEDCQSEAEDLLLRATLTLNLSNTLPESLYRLYQQIEATTPINAQLKTAQKNPELVREGDTNNLESAERIVTLYQREVKPLSSERMDARPWGVASGKSDSEMARQLVKELSAIPNLAERPELLEKFNGAFAYCMHKFQVSNKEHRTEFLKLLEKIPSLYEAVSQQNETNPTEANTLFLQLHNLYERSNFSNRLTAGNSGLIWPTGRSPDGLRELGKGGTKSDFELKDLILVLNEIRKDFGSDESRLEVNTTPLNQIALPAREESLKQNLQSAKKSRTEIAAKLKESCEETVGPINLELLIEDAKAGLLSDTFLSHFSEEGALSLLKDYIYPYCFYNGLIERLEAPQTPASLRFFKQPADATTLLQKVPDNQKLTVMKNMLSVMHGRLSGCPIQDFQVDMLQKFNSAVTKGKPVTIISDTGSGKTTISSVANQILAIDVPAIIHVAPFASKGHPDWRQLENWDQFELSQDGEPIHYWITCEELQSLLSKEERPKLVDTLFVCDEYDSEPYRLNGSERKLQHLLYFDLGCRKILNLSATTNIEELENKIQRTDYKLSTNTLSKEEKTRLELKKTEMKAQKEKLEKGLIAEMARNITLEPLADDLASQMNQFADEAIQAEAGNNPGSCLIECVDQKWDEKSLEAAKEAFSKKDTFCSLLVRSQDGAVTAHTFYPENGNWTAEPFSDFDKKSYNNFEPKPTVVCFYTQDSVGGDFERFSHQGLVRHQVVAYTNEDRTSHSIYQNLRRERRGDGNPMQTPVKMLIGGNLRVSLPEEMSAAKIALIKAADARGATLSHADELSRMQLKVGRKKTALLKNFICQDQQLILSDIETFAKNRFPEDAKKQSEFIAEAKIAVTQYISQKLSDLHLTHDADVDAERAKILAGINSDQLAVALPPRLSGNEAVIQDALLKIGGKLTPPVSSPVNNKKIFDKMAKEGFESAKKEAHGLSYLQVWTCYVREESGNPNISQEIALDILNRIRNLNVSFDLSNPDKPVKELSTGQPDGYFKRALIGGKMDSDDPKNFMNGLRRAYESARNFKAEQDNFMERSTEFKNSENNLSSRVNRINESDLENVAYYQKQLEKLEG